MSPYAAPYSVERVIKLQRRPQRERRQTKRLMSETIAVRVRYKALYISMPSAKQREMIKFCVVCGTWTTTADFSYFHLELNAAIARLA